MHAFGKELEVTTPIVAMCPMSCVSDAADHDHERRSAKYTGRSTSAVCTEKAREMRVFIINAINIAICRRPRMLI